MSTFEITRHREALVVAPVGDIDLMTAGDLREAIFAEVSQDALGVVLDLSSTRYLDSAGIRALFAVSRRLEERRRRLAIAVPARAAVRRVLSIVDIESRADVYETVDEARAGLAGR